MKNKKVQAMLATTIVGAALIGGCGFNPMEEEIATVYGPAPYEEETRIFEEAEKEKDTKEQISENDIKQEEQEEKPEEVFAPEEETEVCVYGPAPTE